MKKRACVQRTLRQRIELLKKWRDNPDWTIVDTVRELGVKESTLRDWKRRYWHRLDKIECDDLMRAKHFIDHYGGGKNKDSEASTTGVGQNNAATTVGHNKAATSVGQNNEVEVPRSGVGDGDDDGVGEQVSEEYPVKEGNAPAEVSSDSCDNGSSSSDECDNSADSDFEVEVTKRMGGELLTLLLPTVLRAPGCRPPAPPDLRPPYPWLRPLLLGAESLLLGTEHV
ncbi:hypothetical protein PF008_g3100 [Phytophthora fragariae]|uniref:Uncharacterized protein n=1 Tax=Phytophthora fragariae TaxID=53985 RepID=A0A6G0SFR7_9STRA|nr:hypothetical protein PF008_g3100 [Phytophthora fragariae]